MGNISQYDIPLVTSVLHPSDFSPSSERAFAYALIVALKRQGKLTLLHVGGKEFDDSLWSRFPSVRKTLERWKLLEKGSDPSAVFENLGVMVKKVDLGSKNALKAIVSYLKEYKTDLIVLATEGRHGLKHLLHPSFAESVLEKTKIMTLFVQSNVQGFVSFQDGSIALRKILIPVAESPNPQEAIVRAVRAAKMGGSENVDMILLHVGEADGFPQVDIPEVAHCTWKKVVKTGKVLDEILNAVKEYSVDMIVMPTQGQQGFLDALRGSVTEQVVRNSKCPVLAVPAGCN
ncbi:MAG: universal stress protein [Candidatus Auribacterota bacterium]